MKKTYQRDLPHVRLYDWMLKSPAYRSLSVYARCLYLEIRRRYNGSNNGAISMAFREAMELVGCSNRPLLTAFAELQEKGFIRPVVKGAFSWKARVDGKNRATTWLLTEFKADFPAPSVTAGKDFMRWSALPKKEKTRCDESIPMVCGEHTEEQRMVCGEHTKRVTRAHHEASKQGADGVRRAHTYITPDRGLGFGGSSDVA